MTSALVTGVAGFLGSHVADHLLRSGIEVVGVDDLSGGFVDNVPAGVRFAQGSVTDRGFMVEVERQFPRVDYVYHLAAYAAEGLSHFIRSFNYENNVVGSANVINFALRTEAEAFVFTSSIAVYGAGQVPLHESMEPRPEDPYGVAKYAVELDLQAAHTMFGLNYIVFRPHNIYGERQNLADPYRNVVGIFMRQLLLGEPMTVFGDGNQTRAFSYVDDIVPSIAAGPMTPSALNQVINVGADEPYTILELATRVAEAVGSPARIEHLPPRNEVNHAFSDHSKSRAIFGTGQSTSLDDGLRRTAAWARTANLSSDLGRRPVEVARNLPPSWRPVVDAAPAHYRVGSSE